MPTTELSSYSDGPSPAPSGGAGGTGAAPPEIVPGPLQPSAGGAGSLEGSQTGADAGVLDSGLGVAPCAGDGEFVAAQGTSCYRLFPPVAAWQAGRATCQGWGGDLAIIESLAEDEFVLANITLDVWIGASDQTTEGQMLWVDGEPVTFDHFPSGQPDDFGGNEDCVEKRLMGGFWNDRPCTGGAPRTILCER